MRSSRPRALFRKSLLSLLRCGSSATCHSTRSSSRREIAIVLVECDCSLHIPSRDTTDACTGRSAGHGPADADLSRCEFLSKESTPFKGTCLTTDFHQRQHPRFRASWTDREGSQASKLTWIEQPGGISMAVGWFSLRVEIGTSSEPASIRRRRFDIPCRSADG
jgi:hypothetical protein